MPPGAPPHWATAFTAHKPGIIPLRPLGFGEILEGSFAAMRRNPKTFFGLALLTSLVVLLVVGGAGALGYLVVNQLGPATSDAVLAVGAFGGLTVLYAASAVISVVLTGMLAYPVGEGVLGRKPSVGETWRHTRRLVLRLAGLCLMLFVPTVVALGGLLALAVWGFSSGSGWAGGLAVFGLLCAIVVAVWLGVRLALSTPALVLEDLRPVASLRRSWELTAGRFWRTFGLLLVASVLIGVVQQVLGIGFQLLGALVGLVIASTVASGSPDAVMGVATIGSGVVGGLLASLVAQPFIAAVAALTYTDARIRREGFDLALVRAVTGAQVHA